MRWLLPHLRRSHFASIVSACYNSRILLFCTVFRELLRIFYRRLGWAVVCLLVGTWSGDAQTTQGLISGRLVDSRTGQPISGATIRYQSQATDAGETSRSDNGGFYNLPLLSPGLYSIRAEATGYQGQEHQE